MLKQKRQLFEFLFMAADLAVVSLAWIVAYWMRFYADIVVPDKGIPPLFSYLPVLIFIWLIWGFLYRRLGLYKAMRGVRRTREIWMLVEANFFAVILFIAAIYLFREKSVQYSRLVFVYFAILATLFTIVERSVLRFLLREVRRRGYNLRFMLLVGAGKVAADIASRVRAHRELGYQLIGCLAKENDGQRGPRGVPVIGTYADLGETLKRMEIDQVVVALPFEDNNYLPEIMSQVGHSLVDVRIVPDIYQFVRVGGAIEEFEGLPVISVQGSPMDSLSLFFKRGLDIILSLIALVLFSPIMLLVYMAVRMTSAGPALYSQERVSLDGSRFAILKFRSMYIDAESDGPGWTKKGDDRVTPIGRFLRRTSLDELPQLFNVLRGDMSIVGPRPERPVFIEEFKQRVPRYMLRHKVPAGMTGWAQVNGWRGDTSIDKRIEHDLYYIENWSIFFDIKIMLLTLLQGFRQRNAC